MNEHDESAPRGRNTRKSRALKRPSRWLEKRSGPMSSRNTAVPGEPSTPAPRLPAADAAGLGPGPVAVAVAGADETASFDDHASDFFREGEQPHDEADAAQAGDGRVDPEVAAAAAARRQAFSRHVMLVVVLSVVLCVVAFVRSTNSASAAMSPPAANGVEQARVAAVSAPLAPAPPPPPTVEPTAPSAEASAAAETAPAAPVAARAAREDARRALDRGTAADAIAAGLRSVELDASDAEAWLILGAAYQLSGNGGAARSAFASCSKLAKRGNVSECRSLLP